MSKIEFIKFLRREYKISVAFARKAYIESDGDLTKAVEYIKNNYIDLEGRSATNSGVIYAYNHPPDNPRIGVLLDVSCGSDFVCMNSEFKTLCKELALQVISGLEGKLEDQPYIRDNSRTVGQLIAEYSQKLGESIKVNRHIRWVR